MDLAEIVFCVVVAMVTLTSSTHGKKQECEVCEAFLTKFTDSIDEETKTTPAKCEKAFKKMCKESKGKDHRFCYYVGGLEESATGLVGEITRPLSFHMPVDKICQKLVKLDSQICDLKYDKKIDFKNVDLKKLRVKELKKILSDWGEDCKGCVEKDEFISLIKKLLPKYEPHVEL